MTRRIAVLFLISACSCMEMRETVERMVMIRTTGSDLQPAATGYIFKKDGDGPASLIKMGESEVMEQLSRLYEQPKAYTAPIPAVTGPFYGKEDENKAASHKEEHVIPVVEKADDDKKGDDHIDGIAEDDYGKMFAEYASHFGDYKGDFDKYLRSLGHFEDGLYHEYGGGKDHADKEYHKYGDKERKGYASSHKYEKGGGDNYHTEKYESYSVSKKGGHKKDYDDSDSYGEHYGHGKGYKGGDHGHKASNSKGEEVDGFHKSYHKNEFKKDHDFYDGKELKGGVNKHEHKHEHHGSDAGGHEKGDAHESKHHEDGFEKGGHVAKESGEEHGAAHGAKAGGESVHPEKGEFSVEDRKYGGKSFGYAIKH